MFDERPRLRAKLLDEIQNDLGAGKRSGNWTMFHCPFHASDTHPSLGVRGERYTCFACGAHGDVFDYLKERRGLEFRQAIAYLDGQLYLSPPAVHLVRTPQPQVDDPCWQAAAQFFVATSEILLHSPQGVAAMQYLLRERGLDELIIRRARLGFHPGGKINGFRTASGRPFSTRHACIVIPYFHQDGSIRAIRLRQSTHDKDYKYISIPGSRLSGAVYYANDFVENRPTVVTEGEFDALVVASRAEGINALTFGAAGARLPEKWAEKLAGERVLLLLDTDQYGHAAAKRIQAMLPHAEILNLPQGKDATEFVVIYQGDLRALISDTLAHPPELPAIHLSAGIASAALLCEAGAQYVMWARLKAAGLDAFTIADGESLGLDDKSLYRVLRADKRAAVRFFAEFPTESDSFKIEEQTSTEFSLGKTAKRRWLLRSATDVSRDLYAHLPFALLARAFPTDSTKAILPPIAYLEPILESFSLDESTTAEIYNALADAMRYQDEVSQRWRLKQYEKWLVQARQWLEEINLILPPAFHNVIELRRVCARALAESATPPQGDEAWAFRLGCSRRAVRGILAGAGVSLIRQSFEVVLTKDNWRLEACLAAKGRGKVISISVSKENEVLNAPFDQALELVRSAPSGSLIRAIVVCPSKVEITGQLRAYRVKRTKQVKRSIRKIRRVARRRGWRHWVIGLLRIAAIHANGGMIKATGSPLLPASPSLCEVPSG